jgi:hypothetical protein
VAEKSDLLLKEAFPLIVHLAHHLRGESAIDAADDLIGRITEHLRSKGLMARPKVPRG